MSMPQMNISELLLYILTISLKMDSKITKIQQRVELIENLNLITKQIDTVSIIIICSVNNS